VIGPRDKRRQGGQATGPDAEWSPAGIVARLDALVAERDAGDVRRAAARCGVTREALAQLAAALADDARDLAAACGAVLAAVARGYRVDATWLVTGDEDFHGDRLAPVARLRVADLLLHVGERLLVARRVAVPPSPATVYDSRHDDDPPP
jgi:hypothetical protein